MCSDGGAGEEIEGLEDEADLLVANAGELVVVELGDVVAVEPVVALRGRVEAADEVHQRGFAGAGGAHDGDVLVVADAEVDAAQGVDLLVAHLVGLPEIVGDDDVAGVGAGGVAGGDRGFDCGFDGHPVLRRCCLFQDSTFGLARWFRIDGLHGTISVSRWLRTGRRACGVRSVVSFDGGSALEGAEDLDSVR